jgi:hypothetical protein
MHTSNRSLLGHNMQSAVQCRRGPVPARSSAGAAQCRRGPVPARPSAGAAQCRRGPVPARPSAGAAQCRHGPVPVRPVRPSAGGPSAGAAQCRCGPVPVRPVRPSASFAADAGHNAWARWSVLTPRLAHIQRERCRLASIREARSVRATDDGVCRLAVITAANHACSKPPAHSVR